MVQTSLRILMCTPAPLRAETLSSTSLHVYSDIHAFLCLSLAQGFGTTLLRAAKIPSSLVGSVGDCIGIFRLPMMYRVCSCSGALRKQPTTIKWSVLYRGSHPDSLADRKSC